VSREDASRAIALGGVIGPVAFIGAWLTGGLITDVDYSPVDDAISRLAAVGADTRPLMTVGFAVFGIAIMAFASVLRSAAPVGPAWISIMATGLATLWVAATPLDRSDSVDSLHGLAATVGYATLVASPLLAAAPLRQAGNVTVANAGVAVAVVSAVSLAISGLVDANGLFQRIGLTVVDLWLVALALLVTTARLETAPTEPPA